QYSKRRDLIITGIPMKQREDTTLIIVDLAKSLGVKIVVKDIYATHRLPVCRIDSTQPIILASKGIRGSLLGWFRSYLNEKNIVTMVEGFTSSSARIGCGVPQDGFAPRDFHQTCDGKGPTITIIQSEKGDYLYGAYTAVPWSTQTGTITDSTAFLFTLINPHALPFTKFHIDKTRAKRAILHHPDCGPVFGLYYPYYAYPPYAYPPPL
ncbi:unnamed protein product, partial [Didymodactylos carnosus]